MINGMTTTDIDYENGTTDIQFILPYPCNELLEIIRCQAHDSHMTGNVISCRHEELARHVFYDHLLLPRCRHLLLPSLPSPTVAVVAVTRFALPSITHAFWGIFAYFNRPHRAGAHNR
jgi:hypothetical protein